MDDLISRQAAITALAYAKETEAMKCGELKGVIEVLNKVPSAEPKRIRGKWIHDGGKWKNRWICSNCGYKWFFDCIEGAYCPNCGADMRGKQYV